MKFFRQQISVFLLAALAFLLVPNVLLHEMLEHHATEDVLCTDWCAEHVDSQHHHCQCLQLFSPPLFHAVNKFSIPFSKSDPVLATSATSSYLFSFSPCLFLRGPPSVL